MIAFQMSDDEVKRIVANAKIVGEAAFKAAVDAYLKQAVADYIRISEIAQGVRK